MLWFFLLQPQTAVSVMLTTIVSRIKVASSLSTGQWVSPCWLAIRVAHLWHLCCDRGHVRSHHKNFFCCCLLNTREKVWNFGLPFVVDCSCLCVSCSSPSLTFSVLNHTKKCNVYLHFGSAPLTHPATLADCMTRKVVWGVGEGGKETNPPITDWLVRW